MIKQLDIKNYSLIPWMHQLSLKLFFKKNCLYTSCLKKSCNITIANKIHKTLITLKVSIVVPVYNVEPYLTRCFDSIMNQTYTNIECVFVDDCSLDKSNAILQQQIAEYSGPIVFKIIKHEVNRGLSVARNSGTHATSGDYIYYLDSDDEITLNCIETLVNVARKYPNVQLVQGNTKTIPAAKPCDDWKNLNYKNFPEYSADHTWIKRHCLLEPRIPVNAVNKLIKRSFIFDHNLFFMEGIIHEDNQWTFYVAKHLSSIAFTKEFGYLHYVVEGSIMQSGCNKKSLMSCLTIIKDWNNNLDSFLLSAQKSTMYVLLRNKLLIANKDGDKEIINEYRNCIKELLKSNFRSLHFNYCSILLLMLLPKRLYNNMVVKKSIGMILKLS